MRKDLRELGSQLLEVDMSKGGVLGVEGWLLTCPEDAWSFLEEGFEEDLNQYEDFNSSSEVREFVQGVGRYDNRNSFFYSFEDLKEQNEEGFMQPPYCHRCVAEVAENGIDEDINPEIEPYAFVGTEDGFRPGFEKEVYELRYICESHPETFFSMRQTEYVEK